jgi:hypothetical protein
MSRLVDGGSPMAFVLSMIAIAVVMACIGYLLSKIEELNNKNGKE